jgi:hypothetical protein
MTNEEMRIAVGIELGWKRGKRSELSFANPSKQIENDCWIRPNGIEARRLDDFLEDWNTRPGMIQNIEPHQMGPLLMNLGAIGNSDTHWVDMVAILKADQPTFCRAWLKVRGKFRGKLSGEGNKE